MKKIFYFLCLIVVVSVACDVSVNVMPTSEIPTTAATPIQVNEPPTTTPEIYISLTQAIPATAMPTVALPVEVTVDPLTITLSPAVASGARGVQVPPTNGQDLPNWELTPGHTVLKLEGYALQDRFLEPQIFVFPALAYAQLVPDAFESMHRLRNVMNDADGVVPAEELPTVPFFRAAQLFASNYAAITFQNGSGVRFLTEYAQYAAPVNNHDLFYHFQGFTSDGEYYVIAIFPISAPILAETNEPGAAIPAGGIALPDINDPNANWQGYYTSISSLLNSTHPDAYAPTISQLDSLVQSIRVIP